MEVRDLIARALLKVISTQRGVADRKRGRSQGRSQAEAEVVKAEARQEALVTMASRIVAIIREKGAPASEGEITRIINGRYITQILEALTELVRTDVLYVCDYNAKGKARYWFR
jgi:hypothetical protein